MDIDTDDSKRKILEMVAQKQISVDEAARLLEALKGDGPNDPDGPRVQKRVEIRTIQQDHDDGPVTSVRVVGTFQALRVVGDPSVQGAVGEGEFHKVREEDGTLIFEESQDENGDSFMLFGPRNMRRTRVMQEDDDDGDLSFSRRSKQVRFSVGRHFQMGDGRPPALRIRMNPDLPLEIDMTAGSARVNGVHGPITANLTAGTGRFEDVQSPIKIGVDAGSLNIKGVFDRGDSEIRCTAGKVRVQLEQGSDVQIKAKATLGRISLPDESGKDADWQGVGSGKREVTIGQGKARLDIEATTGSVSVETA
ncbi:MAG: hypothetical protein LC723_05190 [Actinobacteria bacterium]|nr:hypothetical protein [Actinomycetota bacterium]